MLTYATLYNQHINVEHLPPLEWFFFCEMQSRFEETWASLDNSESFIEKAKKIEEFEVFVKDQIKFLQTRRTTRWPGGNPLSLIVNDMTQRLILRYEYFVTEAKKQKDLPVPCPTYPRNLSNLHENMRQLVDDCGGQFSVARKIGPNQGSLFEHLRISSETLIDTILNVFERTVKFPRLRPKTEFEGKEGDDAWLLEQEIFPSFGDALHQRFSLRLFCSERFFLL